MPTIEEIQNLNINLPGQILFLKLPKEPSTAHLGLVLWQPRDIEWVTHYIDLDWAVKYPNKIQSGLSTGHYFTDRDAAIQNYEKRVQSYLDHYAKVMHSLRQNQR